MANKLLGSVGLSPGSDEGTDLTTKGDVHGYSDTNTRIPIGDNDQVLTADSSEALGLKWATPGGGATASTVNATITSNFTTTATSGTVITGIVITLPTITNGKCLIVFSGVCNRNGNGGLQNYLTTDSTGSDVAIAGTGRGAEGNHDNSRWDLATQAIHDADGSDVSCFCFTGGNTLTFYGTSSGGELDTSISALGVG